MKPPSAPGHPILRLSFVRCLLAVVLSGCPHSVGPTVRPYPAPSDAELLAHLGKRSAALFSMRAEAKADYLSDNGRDRIKISVALLSARPDRLRIAGESSLTGPLLSLATDGKEFQLLDVPKGRFLSGPLSPCNIARLLRVQLHPKDVIAVLHGGVAPLGQGTLSLRYDPKDGGREVLTQQGPETTLTIWFDGPTANWDVRKAELADKNGTVLYRVRHDNFVEMPLAGDPKQKGVRLPQTTYIEDPPHKSDLRLRFRQRELNPTLPDGEDPFRLQTPPGISVEPATCGE